MKGWVIYSAVMTVIAVGGVGAAVGFAVSRATDDDPKVEATAPPTDRPAPQPTEYVPRLTATEAGVKARSHFLPDDWTDYEPDDANALLSVTCSATDFNERDRAWIVVCTLRDFSFTYKVIDATGEVKSVS